MYKNRKILYYELEWPGGPLRTLGTLEQILEIKGDRVLCVYQELEPGKFETLYESIPSQAEQT